MSSTWVSCDHIKQIDFNVLAQTQKEVQKVQNYAYREI